MRLTMRSPQMLAAQFGVQGIEHMVLVYDQYTRHNKMTVPAATHSSIRRREVAAFSGSGSLGLSTLA